MAVLYPLVFRPILQARPWGARELERAFRKQLPATGSFGESWEIADRPDGQSVVANGRLAGKDLHWLAHAHAHELLGEAKLREDRFPLLVSLLDVRQAFAAHVYPPSNLAARIGREANTKFWYVARAEEDAALFAGVKKHVLQGRLKRKLGDGSADECLHRIPVAEGAGIRLPSGRVHALGAGLLVVEIQEHSESPLTVFTWQDGRVLDGTGEFQTDHALASIDFSDAEPPLLSRKREKRGPVEVRNLAHGSPFSVTELKFSKKAELPVGRGDRPAVVAVLSERAWVVHEPSGQPLPLGAGHFCLLPASLEGVRLDAEPDAICLIIEPSVRKEVRRSFRKEWDPHPSSIVTPDGSHPVAVSEPVGSGVAPPPPVGSRVQALYDARTYSPSRTAAANTPRSGEWRPGFSTPAQPQPVEHRSIRRRMTRAERSRRRWSKRRAAITSLPFGLGKPRVLATLFAAFVILALVVVFLVAVL